MAGKCSTVPEDLNSAMSAKGATFRIEKGRERPRSQHDKKVWMYVVSASKNMFLEFLLRKSSSPPLLSLGIHLTNGADCFCLYWKSFTCVYFTEECWENVQGEFVFLQSSKG